MLCIWLAERLEQELKEVFEQDLKYSRPITYEEWNSRGIGERIYEFFGFPVRNWLIVSKCRAVSWASMAGGEVFGQLTERKRNQYQCKP